jgi:transposase-like protein
LNKLPKSLQAKAKRALQDIWMPETRKAAEAAFDAFIESYSIKYDKAVACLTKHRQALLAFYDSRPRIGNIYAPQTPSRAYSRPFAIEQFDQGGASRTRPRSP